MIHILKASKLIFILSRCLFLDSFIVYRKATKSSMLWRNGYFVFMVNEKEEKKKVLNNPAPVLYFRRQCTFHPCTGSALQAV